MPIYPIDLYFFRSFGFYATGARRAEAAHLKISDIDCQRMVFHIWEGKGGKDRDIMLSSKLPEELRSRSREAAQGAKKEAHGLIRRLGIQPCIRNQYELVPAIRFMQ